MTTDLNYENKLTDNMLDIPLQETSKMPQEIVKTPSNENINKDHKELSKPNDKNQSLDSSQQPPSVAPHDIAEQMEGYLRYIIAMACKNKIAPWTRDKTAEEIQADREKKPFNPITGISYSGANGLALESQDKKSGMWLTKKQIEELGGNITPSDDPKDVKGIRTFYTTKENEIKYTVVYNIEDTQNIDLNKLPHHKMNSIDHKPSLDLRGINLLPKTKKEIALYNKAIKNNTDYKVPSLPAPKKQEVSKGLTV